MLAYSPRDDLLAIAEVRRQRKALELPDTALADALSKEEEFGPFHLGVSSELSGHRIQIVGTFALGTDFQNNGTLILSEDNFLRVLPEPAPGVVG